MTTRDVIINRLAKLLRLKQDAEKSSNDETRKNEAERVTTKIEHLRRKYKITTEELEKAQNVDAVGNFFSQKMPTQPEYLNWQQMLAKGLALRHTCQVLTARNQKFVRFIGSQRDIAVCSAQFRILNLAALTEFERVKNEIEEIAPKYLERDFYYGFVATILKRLDERTRRASQALIRIGKDLIRFVETNFEKEVSTNLSTEITNYIALMAGSKAAQKQNLEINLLGESNLKHD